jgi:LysM repeat protein
MKKSWMVGSVVTGHVAALALFMMGGCQSVQRGGGRTAFGGGAKTEGPGPAPARSTTLATAPGGRVIRPASEVGKPGTYTEVVVPRTQQGATKPAIVLPRPAATHPLPPLPAVASTYTVASGDSLGHIAQKHGVRVQDLIRLNSMDDPSKLRVGQKLSIPVATQRPASGGRAVPAATVKIPAGGTSHKVANGESISVIAQKYGVRTADVLKANNLTGSSMIRVGQTLVIPGAKAAAAATPPVPVKPVVEATTPPAPVPPAPLPALPPVPPAPLPTRAATPPAAPAGLLPPAPAGTVGAATPAGTATAPRYKSYTVKENEDVYSVAIKWGIAPTELRQLNNLTSSELTPGQVLRVPE